MPTSLSRRHFDALARSLRSLDPGDKDLALRQRHGQYVRSVSGALQKFNPGFDVEKFHDACHNQGDRHGHRVE